MLCPGDNELNNRSPLDFLLSISTLEMRALANEQFPKAFLPDPPVVLLPTTMTVMWTSHDYPRSR